MINAEEVGKNENFIPPQDMDLAIPDSSIPITNNNLVQIHQSLSNHSIGSKLAAQ